MKKSLIFLAFLLVPLLASAYDVEVGGIYYNLDTDSKQATVTFFNKDYNSYSGSVVVPNAITSDGITYNVIEIGDYAFALCNSLTSVTIGNSVTSIGSEAFWDSPSLMSVTIGNSVISIGVGAFENCHGLTSITIGNSVTNIETGAFKGCNSLTSITLPNSVTSIGYYSFYGCSNIETITIGSGLTSIGVEAFSNCESLLDVYCSATTVPQAGTNVFKGSNVENAILHVPSGSKSKYEAAGAWNIFKEIKEFLPPGSPIITFADATVKALCVENWDTNHDGELSMAEAALVTDLGTVFKSNSTITSFDELQYFTGLTIIGEYAFQGCLSLTSITIPNSVTSIDVEAFSGCLSLTSIDIPNGVTSIEIGAFSGTGLTSVIIPGSVAFIDYNIFSGCPNLSSINVDSENTRYDSRGNCNAVIETASNRLIAGCKNTVIPNSVTSMYNAFEGCTGLTSIDIPNSVKSIGMHAFLSCYNLTSIVIPEGVTLLDNETFLWCGSLASVTLPSSLTEIAYRVFEGCPLTTITIPSSVTSIGEFAFWGCNLTSVTMENPEPITLNQSAFSNRANATLYVPAGTKEAYENADVWKEFGNIVEIGSIDEPDKLTIAPMTLRTGKTSTLSISLDNEDELIAFEFFMTLPEGISIDEDGDGYLDAVLSSGRSNRHSLEVEQRADGSYHFLCYSNSNNALKGNSGELLSITLCCEEGMEPGTYEGLLSTIKFSDPDWNRIVLPDLSFDIEVTDVTMGDVNDDGSIDVMDIVAMVNKIMEHPSASFVFAAADHNGDNLIDVMDLVREVALVMSQTANAPSGSFDGLSGALSLQPSTDGTVSLSISDASRYVASQFVVTLSPGQHLADVTTDSRHTVSFERIADNQYAVVSYSPGNDTYTSNAAALTLHVEGVGEVSVDNAVFASEGMEKVLFQGVGSGYTDGIRGLTYDFSTPADIYSPSGILLRRNATSADGLKPGVYIVNGHKYIKKN